MRNRLFIAFFTTLYFSLNLFATTSEELAKKLIKAYPDFLEKYENNYIYFKNGDKIIFSSPKNYTNYEDKLNNASLEDQMSIPYKKIENNDNFIPSVNDDAGRFRNQDFFKKMLIFIYDIRNRRSWQGRLGGSVGSWSVRFKQCSHRRLN